MTGRAMIRPNPGGHSHDLKRTLVLWRTSHSQAVSVLSQFARKCGYVRQNVGGLDRRRTME